MQGVDCVGRHRRPTPSAHLRLESTALHADRATASASSACSLCAVLHMRETGGAGERTPSQKGRPLTGQLSRALRSPVGQSEIAPPCFSEGP